MTTNSNIQPLEDMRLPQVVLPDAPLNPQDLADFCLPQDYHDGPVTKKVPAPPKIQRPPKGIFVRTHKKHRFDALVVEDPKTREPYLLAPAIACDLDGEFVRKRIVLTVDRDGQPYLWPIRLPDDDGSLDSYNESAHIAAATAEDSWVRIQANTANKVYDTRAAVSPGPDPVWPEEEFNDLVAKSFGNRVIRTLDHPLIKRLKGEI